jgi:uncharacterized protein (TIGR00255 family)
MLSMTGYGAGEASLGGGHLTLELRALNHRFVEVRVRLPPELGDFGSFLEQLVRERLDRGRIDVAVRVTGAALPAPRFSRERARVLYGALAELRDELSPGSELSFTALAGFPNLLLEPVLPDVEAIKLALGRALDQALEQLALMRATEGSALRRELASRLEQARSLGRTIRERASNLAELQRGRLRERLERLLHGSAPLDRNRLENEVALMADRSDISEELARLESHFDQVGALLSAEGPVGRKLDFLLQEVARELNTTGAKSQDAPVAQLVVETKVCVERMREQVQNVE